MNLNQVTAMKAKVLEELRQVDKLKQSMENTLAGLVQWEKSLQGATTGARKAVVKESTPDKTTSKATPNHGSSPELTPSDRVNKALRKLHGEFSRSDLLAEVESDGKGMIAAGTFGNIFLKLVKKEQIKMVRGEVGSKNCRYMKSSESGGA